MAQSRMLKSLLFYPLMFLRPLAKIVLRFLSGILFLGIGVALLMGQPGLALYTAAWSFAFFLLSWFYDSLLLELNPQDTLLILN